MVVIWFCTFGCKENPQAMETVKPQLWSSLKALLINPKFWIFGLTNAFYTAAMSLVLQAVPFFVLYTLKLDNSKTTVLLGSVLIFAIFSVIIWAGIVKRFKLMPAWRSALMIMSVGFIPLYFMKNIMGTAIMCCFIGFGIAGVKHDCTARY